MTFPDNSIQYLPCSFDTIFFLIFVSLSLSIEVYNIYLDEQLQNHENIDNCSK